MVIIKTNWAKRKFQTRNMVPDKLLKTRFSYLDNEVWSGYFKYLGYWEHCCDYIRTNADEFKDWDGINWSSMTTGTLIKVDSDNETYQIASFRTVNR